MTAGLSWLAVDTLVPVSSALMRDVERTVVRATASIHSVMFRRVFVRCTQVCVEAAPPRDRFIHRAVVRRA